MNTLTVLPDGRFVYFIDLEIGYKISIDLLLTPDRPFSVGILKMPMEL